jgi:hypothetical protein
MCQNAYYERLDIRIGIPLGHQVTCQDWQLETLGNNQGKASWVKESINGFRFKARAQNTKYIPKLFIRERH